MTQCWDFIELSGAFLSIALFSVLFATFHNIKESTFNQNFVFTVCSNNPRDKEWMGVQLKSCVFISSTMKNPELVRISL